MYFGALVGEYYYFVWYSALTWNTLNTKHSCDSKHLYVARFSLLTTGEPIHFTLCLEFKWLLV
jgi:hypothetical protein